MNSHPLQSVFTSAIEQVVSGKGKRHGGGEIPFMEQPWVHYAKMHGRGFLTGQAAKKLEEAVSKPTVADMERELLGAMVYLGMAVLDLRQYQEPHSVIGVPGDPNLSITTGGPLHNWKLD